MISKVASLFSLLHSMFINNFKMSRRSIYVIGAVGFFGHILYWAWWTYVDPMPEIASLRIIGIITCLSLLLHKQWPKSFQGILPLYWLLVVTFNFPFFFTTYLINTNFSLIWSMAEVTMLFFATMVIYNRLLLLLSFAIGIGSAILYSQIKLGGFSIDNQLLLFSYFPVFLFSAIGGIAVNCSSILSIFDERKKSFEVLSSSIAHELKNPTNSIGLAANQIKAFAIGLIKIDLDKDGKIPFKKLKDIRETLDNYCDIILASNKRAGNINNIILNDLGNKKIDPQYFVCLEAAIILPKIIKEYGYESLEEKKKVNLNLDLGKNFLLKADESLFTFTVSTIIKSILHFSKLYSGGNEIEIGTETLDTDPNGYNSIYFLDKNLKIPNEIINTIFEDSFLDVGLGLPFCKKAMDILGGTIWCKSDPDLGFKLIISLPNVDDDEIKKYNDGVRIKRILIVDDQKTNLLIGKKKIETNLPNIRCDIVDNGFDAIKAIRDNSDYSLVLMDIEMPKMDGIETTRRIKEFNLDIPIIAYTSKEDGIDEIRAVTDDYLKKPAHDYVLYRTITKWFDDSSDNFEYIGDYRTGGWKSYTQILKGKRVLLADDQKTVHAIYGGRLKNNGMIVVSVYDGDELIKTYNESVDKEKPFDIIITDINMPNCNGDIAAKEIRKNNKTIPIIAISADGDKKSISNFFSCGINDCFVKNKTSEVLLPMITNLLVARDSIPMDDPMFALEPPKEIEVFKDPFSGPQLLNIDRIMEFFNENDRLDILRVFLVDSKKSMDEITQYKSGENIRELSSAVHALKGASGIIGAERLFECLDHINMQLKRGFLPCDLDWFEQIEKAYEELVKRVKGIIRD